jgi:hypothetical protein
MIENATVSYAVITFFFMINFVMSIVMTHVVVSRLRAMTPWLYYWIFCALAFEGAIALASFYPVLSPEDRIAGVPVPVWLNAAYAVGMANIYAWTIAFHVVGDRWKTSPST